MKFLCLDCDEAMKLHSTAGPDEGSLTVTFRCPECGFRVAMLTNPFETQMVRSLGVKVGGAGAAAPAPPFQHLRSAMAHSRADAFAPAPESEGASSACPFAAALGAGNSDAGGDTPAAMVWEPSAEARLANIPSFIRPMAKRSIERFAESKGYGTVTEAVMDEARTAFGM
jgi:DNA-directed RNA polymerase subunit RPC12/RpoP